MDFAALQIKRDFYLEHKDALTQATRENYEGSFAVDYTHNSTAIEGNTLSLMETKLLLEDKLSVGGKKLREIYEITNQCRQLSRIR